MLERIFETFGEEDFQIADGFDEAVIGVESRSMRLIYSRSKCIEILMRDMSREEAEEYFDFNVCDAYVGEKTPIWCDDDFE